MKWRRSEREADTIQKKGIKKNNEDKINGDQVRIKNGK